MFETKYLRVTCSDKEANCRREFISFPIGNKGNKKNQMKSKTSQPFIRQ